MALQKFLVDFDLNGNQIKNAVLGTVAGTLPGAVWFDSASKEVKFVDENGSVKAVAPTSVTDALASDIADVAADLASEVTRATGVEAGLASDIADVAGDLATETSARESADSALDSRLDTVEGQIAALDSTYATDAALSSAVSAINAGVTAGFTQGANRMTAIEAVNTTQNGRLDAVEGDLAALDATYASDAALSGAVSALEAADASIASDLADEVSAREAAVAVVAGDLATEVTRATGAEAGIAADLATEVARAEAAEGVLDGRLDTVEGQIAALDSTYATDAALSGAVSAINTAVTAGFTQGANRMTAIEAVNTTQNGRLDAVEASVAGLDSTYATDAALSGAVSSLEAADASIASDLADEVSAREAAVAAVAGDLTSEVSRATAAEAGLASDIADLGADLSSEVARAEAAEGALDSRLDSVEGTLAALDATYATEVEVAAAVAVETAARESADSALDARIDTIESNFTRKYAVAVGNGSATSFTVTHNLGTSDVVVSVRESSTGAVVVAAVTHSSDNTVTVEVNGTAPANNALKVVVIG